MDAAIFDNIKNTFQCMNDFHEICKENKIGIVKYNTKKVVLLL